MAARELNLRSKELLTVSRLRMIKENSERGRALGRLNVTDKDVAKISGWIEDDSVSQDMYIERLDTMLEVGAKADKDALAMRRPLRRGTGTHEHLERNRPRTMKQDEAFEEADKAVRKRQADKSV